MGGSAKKMKTGLGAKPGIFGSATADEPEEAAPAAATALPRRALASGLPAPAESVSGFSAAMMAAQAAAASVSTLGAGGSPSGFGAAGSSAAAGAGSSGLPGQPMNVQAAVQQAVQNAAAMLSAGGIGVPSGGLVMNAVGRIDNASLGTLPAGAPHPDAAGSSTAPDESPEHPDESPGPGPQRRGDYTFCRKYTRSRTKRVPECEGLRSIDVYENLGMVGRGSWSKMLSASVKRSASLDHLKAWDSPTLSVASAAWKLAVSSRSSPRAAPKLRKSHFRLPGAEPSTRSTRRATAPAAQRVESAPCPA